MPSKQWEKFETETALDPALPIVDPHHHIWAKGWSHDLFDPYDAEELIADMANSGHNVIATVLVDSHAQHHTEGPVSLRPVGETEYAEKVAQDAQRRGGKAAGICSAIVPHADLGLGSAVGEVLDAHAAASPRFRGIRHMLAFDLELPPIYGATLAGISKKPAFRQGFAELSPRGLHFEAWVLQPQLDEVLDLARAFPDTTIVLNHLGGPLGIGRFAGQRPQAFQLWKDGMARLADCANIVVKLGGIYVTQTEPTAIAWPAKPLSSEEMAGIHREYVLTAIDLFTPSRCMFESNFPVDMLYTSYDTLWNSHKRIAVGFTQGEREDMFAGVAQRIYKLV
jgi:predicted TIM-barrel fold metal-dependent hydrolase